MFSPPLNALLGTLIKSHLAHITATGLPLLVIHHCEGEQYLDDKQFVC